MSATAPPQPTVESELGFPVAAIVCLAVTGYVALILLIIVLKNVLVNRGVCTCDAPCGSKDGQVCSKCCSGASLAESCNCCASPSINSCVNAICPAKRNIGIMDILLCQCCCGDDTTNVCSCIHLDLDFEIRSLNCCCCTIHLVKMDQPQPWPYSNNPSPQLGVSYPPLPPGSTYPPLPPGANYPPQQTGGRYPPVLPGESYPPVQRGGRYPPVPPGSSYPVHYGVNRPSMQTEANFSMNNSTKNINTSVRKSFSRTHLSLVKSSIPARNASVPRQAKGEESAVNPLVTSARGGASCLTLREEDSNISLSSKRSLEAAGRSMDANNSAKRMNLDLNVRHHSDSKHLQGKQHRTKLSITNPYSARPSARPDLRCLDTQDV